MTVIEYVTEEVSRQGHRVNLLDGIERVGWMLNGWSYALKEVESGRLPLAGDIIHIGRLVEPEKNRIGIRRVGVRVGSRYCPEAHLVEGMLMDLCDRRDSLEPLDFYRALLEVHPFVDGNGRTGKIVLNWLAGTLLTPFFPPNAFWGRSIRNP